MKIYGIKTTKRKHDDFLYILANTYSEAERKAKNFIDFHTDVVNIFENDVAGLSQIRKNIYDKEEIIEIWCVSSDLIT